MNRKQLGAEGEQFVSVSLQQQQFEIIEMNWRCRFGELDIVAKKQQLLYFVEVRTRTINERQHQQFGQAIEAINQKKIKKLYQLAQLYCYENNYTTYNYRILFAPVSYNKDTLTFNLDSLLYI